MTMLDISECACPLLVKKLLKSLQASHECRELALPEVVLPEGLYVFLAVKHLDFGDTFPLHAWPLSEQLSFEWYLTVADHIL